MTDQPLADFSVAILLANGFAEEEFAAVQRALLNAGASVTVVSLENGLANGWHDNGWGHYFPIDKALSTALAADFDALFVPSGSRHVERLSGQAHASRFVRGFMDGEKPLVLSGEAASLLVVSDRAEGRSMVEGPIDTEAAAEKGATLVDADTKVDNRLLTMRLLPVETATEMVLSHFETANGNVSEAA